MKRVILSILLVGLLAVPNAWGTQSFQGGSGTGAAVTSYTTANAFTAFGADCSAGDNGGTPFYFGITDSVDENDCTTAGPGGTGSEGAVCYCNPAVPGAFIPGGMAFPGPSSSSAFNDVTSGTNTTAEMTVGNGATLAPTGTGTITSNVIFDGSSTATVSSAARSIMDDATVGDIRTTLGAQQIMSAIDSAVLGTGSLASVSLQLSVSGSADTTLNVAQVGNAPTISLFSGGSTGPYLFQLDNNTRAEIRQLFNTSGTADCRLDATDGVLNVTASTGSCDLQNAGSSVITAEELDTLAEWDPILGVTGTASASTFLSGNNSWAALPTATDSVEGIFTLCEDNESSASCVVVGNDSRMGTLADHGSLDGLTDDDHAQYTHVQTGTADPNVGTTCPTGRAGKAHYLQITTDGWRREWACTTEGAPGVWALTGRTLGGEEVLARLQNLTAIADRGRAGGRRQLYFDADSGDDTDDCSEATPCETLTRAAVMCVSGTECIFTGTFDDDGASDDDFGNGLPALDPSCDDTDSACIILRSASAASPATFDCLNNNPTGDMVIGSVSDPDGGWLVVENINITCDEATVSGYSADADGKLLVVGGTVTLTSGGASDQAYTSHDNGHVLILGSTDASTTFEATIRGNSIVYIGSGTLTSDAASAGSQIGGAIEGGGQAGESPALLVIGPTVSYITGTDTGGPKACLFFDPDDYGDLDAVFARVLCVGPNEPASTEGVGLYVDSTTGDLLDIDLYQTTFVGQDRGVHLIDTAASSVGAITIDGSAVLFEAIESRIFRFDDASTAGVATGTWDYMWLDEGDVATEFQITGAATCTDFKTTNCTAGGATFEAQATSWTFTNEQIASADDPFLSASYICDPAESSPACFGVYDSYYTLTVPRGIPEFVLGQPVTSLILNGSGGNIGAR